MADLAELSAVFCARLRAAGLAVSVDRAARFPAAVRVLQPETTAELYRVALVTLACDPAEFGILAAVFDQVFRGVGDPSGARGQQGEQPQDGARPTGGGVAGAPYGIPNAGQESGKQAARPGELRAVATGVEALRTKEFTALTAQELAWLAGLARRFRITTPRRRSRRACATSHGRHIDLRATLRSAGRGDGYPLPLRLRSPRLRSRRLVVLCDISGSMEHYTRALVQLLHGALGGAKAEVFTFATRLTRLTPVLAAGSPSVAIRRAGQAAPDWSGGTRIAEALTQFDRHYGARGMARGAVVLILSDGWETGDPAELGKAMARLARLAHRIVWANPRTASARFRPLAGGMAAALPFCDAVVSAHNFAVLDELFTALAQE
ncbi:MAG: vWA domain-containing protein [Sciscionella sp.]